MTKALTRLLARLRKPQRRIPEWDQVTPNAWSAFDHLLVWQDDTNTWLLMARHAPWPSPGIQLSAAWTDDELRQAMVSLPSALERHAFATLSTAETLRL